MSLRNQPVLSPRYKWTIYSLVAQTIAAASTQTPVEFVANTQQVLQEGEGTGPIKVTVKDALGTVRVFTNVDRIERGEVVPFTLDDYKAYAVEVDEFFNHLAGVITEQGHNFSRQLDSVQRHAGERVEKANAEIQTLKLERTEIRTHLNGVFGILSRVQSTFSGRRLLSGLNDPTPTLHGVLSKLHTEEKAKISGDCDGASCEGVGAAMIRGLVERKR